MFWVEISGVVEYGILFVGLLAFGRSAILLPDIYGLPVTSGRSMSLSSCTSFDQCGSNLLPVLQTVGPTRLIWQIRLHHYYLECPITGTGRLTEEYGGIHSAIL